MHNIKKKLMKLCTDLLISQDSGNLYFICAILKNVKHILDLAPSVTLWEEVSQASSSYPHWQPFTGNGHVFGDPAGDLIIQDFSITVHTCHCHDDGHTGAHQI